MLASLLLYFQKWKKFEILGELSAQAQSQQVIWRIMLNGFLNFFNCSRACFLHSLNILRFFFTVRVASNIVKSSVLSNSVLQ